MSVEEKENNRVDMFSQSYLDRRWPVTMGQPHGLKPEQSAVPAVTRRVFVAMITPMQNVTPGMGCWLILCNCNHRIIDNCRTSTRYSIKRFERPDGSWVLIRL